MQQKQQSRPEKVELFFDRKRPGVLNEVPGRLWVVAPGVRCGGEKALQRHRQQQVPPQQQAYHQQKKVEGGEDAHGPPEIEASESDAARFVELA